MHSSVTLLTRSIGQPKKYGSFNTIICLFAYCVAMLRYFSRLQSNLIDSTALRAASLYSVALTQDRTLYTFDVVTKVKGMVLDINKIQFTATSFQMNPIAINTLISKATLSNQVYADQYGALLHWQPDGDSNVYIRGDENRLNQVLSNLLSNAIKCSPKSAPVVISTKHDNRNVRLAITDSG